MSEKLDAAIRTASDLGWRVAEAMRRKDSLRILQEHKCVEECGELITALARYRDGRDEAITEEACDVLITVLQILHYQPRAPEMLQEKLTKAEQALRNSLIETELL